MSKRVLDYPKTSIQIKKLIKDKKLSYKEAQEELNLACIQTIYSWISTNKKSLPTLDNVVLLAECLQVPVDEILVRSEIEN